MGPDYKLVVTSKERYDEIRGYYTTRGMALAEEEKPLTVGGLKIEWQSLFVPRVVDHSKHNGMAAYMDTKYVHLRDWSHRGWRTVWMNRKGSLSPDTLPVQDVELRSLDALSQVPLLLTKPTLSQCLAWWEEWTVPDNIRRHVTAVAWCAYVLAVLMRNKGIELDPVLAHRGGLLHDIDKIQTLGQTHVHGEKGAEFLEAQGYPDTAAIVRGHIMHKILEPHADDRPWETKLVYFADKLIEGDRIVPFDVRLQALNQRYPGYRESMQRAEASVWRLNEKICSILSISSHEILISNLIELQNY